MSRWWFESTYKGQILMEEIMIQFKCDDVEWTEMYRNYLCRHNCQNCYHKICNYENAKKLFKLWKKTNMEE